MTGPTARDELRTAIMSIRGYPAPAEGFASTVYMIPREAVLAALAATRSEAPGELDAETLAEALTMYAQIGDWLHGGITLEGAREVAQKLVVEYRRLREARS